MDYLAVVRRVRAEQQAKPSPPSDPMPPLEVYRARLHEWWSLTAQGQAADHETVFSTLYALDQLSAEVGADRSAALRQQWAAEWHRRTGRCPTCGERGPLHLASEASPEPRSGDATEDLF